MTETPSRPHSRSGRLTTIRTRIPAWYGWLGIAAMFLLVVVRIRVADGIWFFPLLSLGEWLLLPLGVASLSMGFLSLGRIRERTLLPLWLAALVPGLLWLAATGIAVAAKGAGPRDGDLILAWAVRLLFPTLVFLPLFTINPWRDRLMWALTAGLVMNILAILWETGVLGVAPPDRAALALGGLMGGQRGYAAMLCTTLPLLAAWRGGNGTERRSLVILVCTFLLPALALGACHSWAGFAASLTGLLVTWAAWRSHAWVLGIFLVLLILGHGGESRRDRDRDGRRLMAESSMMDMHTYKEAFATFQTRPMLGSGPEAFLSSPSGPSRDAGPWYAFLLGGTGMLGLGMWLVLLAELAARSMGRFGRRCLWHGGVLGGVAGVAAVGLWVDALPGGAGAMVGVLIALSILEEPDDHVPVRRPRQMVVEDVLPTGGGSDTVILHR